MLGVVKLLDVKGVVLEFNEGTLVVVHIAVVWSREDGDDSRKV